MAQHDKPTPGPADGFDEQVTSAITEARSAARAAGFSAAAGDPLAGPWDVGHRGIAQPSAGRAGNGVPPGEDDGLAVHGME